MWTRSTRVDSEPRLAGERKAIRDKKERFFERKKGQEIVVPVLESASVAAPERPSVGRTGYERESQVSVCVQERLLCPAGVSPVGVTIGSPVAGWQAGGKPKDRKPIDNPIRGMGASRRAVTKGNARWPRK